MVPSICGPHRDETEIHLEHLPVHWVLWRTGPDKSEKLTDIFQSGSVFTKYLKLNLHVPSSLCSFIISLATSWTILHHQAMNVRFLHWFPVCICINKWFFFSFCELNFRFKSSQPFRKFDLTHLQRERGLSRCRVGEVLLLQEYWSARDLLRTTPHLPSDGRPGGRSGGSLQEQEGRSRTQPC